MQFVADTNILVSAFLWGGKPAAILEAARSKRISLFTSPALLVELEETLARRKFIRRLREVRTTPTLLAEDYRALAHTVKPAAVTRVVASDPDDDHVIACALAARVDAIVSGDSDLLTLGRHEQTPILTAAQALSRIERGSGPEVVRGNFR